MAAAGRKWRIGVALGVLAALVLLPHIADLGPEPAPAGHPAAPVRPVVDLDGLYDLDHLVLVGDPELDLDALVPVGPVGPVGAGPPGPPVPEPGAAMLWILGLTALCTLYLPPRSW